MWIRAVHLLRRSSLSVWVPSNSPVMPFMSEVCWWRRVDASVDGLGNVGRFSCRFSCHFVMMSILCLSAFVDSGFRDGAFMMVCDGSKWHIMMFSACCRLSFSSLSFSSWSVMINDQLRSVQGVWRSLEMSNFVCETFVVLASRWGNEKCVSA